MSGTHSKADQIRFARYQSIKAEVEALEEEMKDVDCDKMVKDHIKALNQYNERKDACLVLIGKLTTLEQTTSSEIYKKLDLTPED